GQHLNYLITCESIVAILQQFQWQISGHPPTSGIGRLRKKITNALKRLGGHQVHDVDPNRRPTATFVFSHAGLMGKLLARLGLFRQTKDLYLAKNYDRLGHDRTWRTSHLVPFSANLVFALHD
ncbi:unnamed protein product, partial [Cyprideis torosa]